MELFVFARLHAREGQEAALAQGATSIVGKDFLPAIAPTSPLLGGAIGVLLRDDGIVPLIRPTCQNVFAGIAQSVHASDHHATLHGVVFDILANAKRLPGDHAQTRKSRGMTIQRNVIPL